MALFGWRCCRIAPRRLVLARAAAGAILFAFGLGQSTPGQTSSQASAIRVFIGYEYQRADLIPTTLGALNGGAFSIERVTPHGGASLVLDIRVGQRSGRYFGYCELCPSPPTTPNDHALNTQALLLAGPRASLSVRGARAFIDVLAGIGYLGWSSPDAFPPEGKGTGSPLAEAGAGIDVPIGGPISVRTRASLLASDWDTNPFEATRLAPRVHMGLSAGVVLRP
jgi:hypothetical protein